MGFTFALKTNLYVALQSIWKLNDEIHFEIWEISYSQYCLWLLSMKMESYKVLKSWFHTQQKFVFQVWHHDCLSDLTCVAALPRSLISLSVAELWGSVRSCASMRKQRCAFFGVTAGSLYGGIRVPRMLGPLEFAIHSLYIALAYSKWWSPWASAASLKLRSTVENIQENTVLRFELALPVVGYELTGRAQRGTVKEKVERTNGPQLFLKVFWGRSIVTKTKTCIK